MKILMLGDYSNLHACLSAELRKRGHEITLVSDKGGHMQTDADIALIRNDGLFGSIQYIYRIMALLPSWTGYDVVQLINPVFFKLKPSKLRIIFDILKKNNRSIHLTLCGNDHYFVKDCVDSDIFRFSEFRVGNGKTPMTIADPRRELGWLTAEHASYHKHLYENIDGAIAVLPEYHMSARLHIEPSKLIFTNLPIELESLKYNQIAVNGAVRILVGMRGNMEIQKGTAKLLDICRSLEQDMPADCEVRVAKDLTLTDYLEELKRSHIVIDQLYSYSPATNALQTMALGRITASGAQPEYYSYIRENTRPIFCLSPLEDDNTIKDRLRSLISDKEALIRMSEDGRRLVERHNDVKEIATLFENHWQNMMKQ